MIRITILILILCAFTILLESTIPTLFVREKKAWWKASVICNIVTNPLLNLTMLLFFYFIESSLLTMIIMVALEAAVVFIEAYFYKVMLAKNYLPCFLFSLAANFTSFSVGMGISILIS